MSDNTRPHLAAIHGRSHVKGETTPPLWIRTIPEVLAETVKARGGAECAVFPDHGIRWTWDAFGREVERVAAGFNALGLEKGDRIGIWSPNRPEWLVTQFASARAGLVLVTINPAYRVHELEYVLNKVGIKAIVAAESFKTSRYLAMIEELAPELSSAKPGDLHAARLPDLRIVIRTGDAKSPGMLNFWDIPALAGPEHIAALEEIAADASPDDAINVQFTSGRRQSEGRDAQPCQYPQQWPLHRCANEFFNRRQARDPRAALPLLRHVDGDARLRLDRHDNGFPVRGV